MEIMRYAYYLRFHKKEFYISKNGNKLIIEM